MPRESEFYRDNLEAVLRFTGGRQMLSMADVMKFTGIKSYATARKRFPFYQKTISAPTLARCMSKGATI